LSASSQCGAEATTSRRGPAASSYLDKAVTRVAREIRLLEQAMKAANAKTVIDGYDQDDAVLGELT